MGGTAGLISLVPYVRVVENKVQRRLKSYTGAAASSASLEATGQTLARELGGYLREERIYARDEIGR